MRWLRLEQYLNPSAVAVPLSIIPSQSTEHSHHSFASSVFIYSLSFSKFNTTAIINMPFGWGKCCMES